MSISYRVTNYSGEINYRVNDMQQTIEKVLQYFQPQNPVIDHTDGVSAEFADWRFNLRGSNTEPLLRLNVETRGNITAVIQRVQALESLIKATI